MAASTSQVFFSVLLAFSLFISGVLGGITCEKLDCSTCAFAVSSSGSRCVLEKHVRERGGEESSCRNSGVVAAGFAGWVETDECLAACGLNRETFGISSDLLLDQQFMNRLCSPECYQGCPNVVDLYYNLAAGEGSFLPSQCAVLKSTRREIAETENSGKSEAAYTPEAAPVGYGRKLIASGYYGGDSAPPPESAATGRKLTDYGYYYGSDSAPPPEAGRKLIDYGYYYGGDSVEPGRKLTDYGYYYGGDSATPQEPGRKLIDHGYYGSDSAEPGRKLIDYGYYYGGDGAPPPEPERRLEEYGYGYGNAQPPL